MPFSKKTLTDLLQSLADRHESNGTVPASSATIAFWTRLLNKGVAYCADKLRLTKSTSLTTVSGVIALPDDFLVRDSVFKGDIELTQVDANPANVGLCYWITGNQTDGFVLNTTEDETYTVNYAFKPADLVNGTDKCIIPDPEAVVAYAYSKIRKAESDPFEDADEAMTEVDIRIKEMISQFAVNTNSVSFTIE